MNFNHQSLGYALSLKNISRRFDNKFVLEDVTLSVEPGKIVALLGPNGAGKTTTIKIASTLLTPSCGSVSICGIDALKHPYEARKRFGVVLGGDLGFYPRVSGYDNLLFFADLAKIESSKRRQRVAQVLSQVDLTDSKDKPVYQYSKGMLQRLHIARALLNEPQLLFLDEPTNGLDPDIAQHIRSLIQNLSQQGVGILLTSHSLSEIEELAHEIYVISRGRIFVKGTIEDLSHVANISFMSACILPHEFYDSFSDLKQMLSNVDATATLTQYQSQWLLNIAWSGTSYHTPNSCNLTFEQHIPFKADDLVTRRPRLEELYLALVERLKNE